MPFPHSPPQKTLIINIFGIGDVLFTTPLIANLKAQYPGMSIGYLCNNRTADMLRNNPHIDKLHIYERDAFKDAAAQSKTGALNKVFKFIKEIKREGYESSIDVSMNDFIGWATFMAGIKQRVGFKYKGRGRFLNQPVPMNGYEDQHVVEYYLNLLEHIGVKSDRKDLQLEVSPQDAQWADEFCIKQVEGISTAKPIGLVPGGGASWGKDAAYKRWDAEKYAKLADYLIEKFSAPIILFGDKSELDLCGKVSAHMAHTPAMACGKTSIGQFAALARKCAIVILNDGGPLHIAVAAGVKTASIFGPVNDRVYGPYPQGNHIVIKKNLACQPCYRQFRRASCDHISCLSHLTVEEVFNQVQGAL